MLTTLLMGVGLLLSNTAKASIVSTEFSPAGDLARITLWDVYDAKNDASRLFDLLKVPAVEDRQVLSKKLESPDRRFTLICERTVMFAINTCRFEVHAGADSVIDPQGGEARYQATAAAAARLHRAFGAPGETVPFQTSEDPARIRVLSSATDFEFAFK